MILECSLAIIKDSNKLLYSLRVKQPYQNYYEFPGGKVEKNESPENALYRECFEELGIKVSKFNRIGSLVHHYDHLEVKLHIFEILDYQGYIYPKENQELLYMNAFESEEKFIDSTYRILNYLNLPRYCSITSIDADNHSNEKISKIYLNNLLRYRSDKISPKNYCIQAEKYSKLCSDNNIHLILDATYYELFKHLDFKGIHYKSNQLQDLENKEFVKPNNSLIYSASCHNISDIHIANKHDFDFILLSPVLVSKLDINTLGWDGFEKLALKANMPVFSLGGMRKSDLDDCISHNGYGVSGITNF
jgi:8-oxo-dGTP diphosphatase